MTENKQTESLSLNTTDQSQGPIFIICTEARADQSHGTMKMPPRHAAESTQLRQRNQQTSMGMSMLLLNPMVSYVNYSTYLLERRVILELLVLGLFDKSEFSIDRHF